MTSDAALVISKGGRHLYVCYNSVVARFVWE
jgi:hypothetical protein